MRTTGTVKWFDAATGSGCAASEGGVQAIFGREALAPFGVTSVDAGTHLVFELKLESGALVVREIHDIAGQVTGSDAISTFPSRPRPSGVSLGRMTAKVNWYDHAKGFGFAYTKFHGDALVHRSVIEAAGLNALNAGAIVDCDIVQHRSRIQVSAIHALLDHGTPPRTISIYPSWAKGCCVEINPDKNWQRADCRWYSRTKGFGFLRTFDPRVDVFVHGDVLRQCGVNELTKGQQTLVRLGHYSRGYVATEIQLVWPAPGVRPPTYSAAT